MTAKNDITGDSIRSKDSSDAYRDNYDKIFRKKELPIVYEGKVEDKECSSASGCKKESCDGSCS